MSIKSKTLRNRHFALILAGATPASTTSPLCAEDNSPPAEAARVETAEYASIAPPEFGVPASTSQPTALTPDQIANLHYWTEHTHLPGPVLGGALPGGPAPARTESKLAELSAATPLAAGTATIFRNKNVKSGGIIPPGFLSHVEECSTAVGGRYAWFTGNWFAARP